MSRAERAEERDGDVTSSLEMLKSYMEATKLLGNAWFGVRNNERTALIADSVLAVGVALLGELDNIGTELEANTAELERVRELLDQTTINKRRAAAGLPPVEGL